MKFLKSIINSRKLQANGVTAFFAAYAVGDDVEVYEDDDRTSVKRVFHTIRFRQQELSSWSCVRSRPSTLPCPTSSPPRSRTTSASQP